MINWTVVGRSEGGSRL